MFAVSKNLIQKLKLPWSDLKIEYGTLYSFNRHYSLKNDDRPMPRASSFRRKNQPRYIKSDRNPYYPQNFPQENSQFYYQQQQQQQQYEKQQQYQYDSPNRQTQGQPAYEHYYPYSFNVPNPGGILQPSDALVRILEQPTIVLERKVEFMNLFLGFEQANRYTIMDPVGNHIGYLEEEDFGIMKAVMRQVYRLHRPFSVRVLDRYQNHVMTIRRPFSFINSHIKSILPSTGNNEGIILGETKQSWHLWRRRYDLYLAEGQEEYRQFGTVDSGFLGFSFPVFDETGAIIGAIDRNWVGIGREFFTDTGVYVLRMDPSSFQGLESEYGKDTVISGPLTLDQRAVMLGNAVSIDYDYFSRHSGRGGLFSAGSYE
ncbi:Scramblase-domain-containing protein [Nadsonia fulvescens var. elongata DSM 6958]|uniref:Phospholipid scramblase n=1 Tax=Nadsonia fulvescens var. elongata DSM 6958 TaxID=857566 RepID=A0A1E3PRW8_9ASCO|nr:Scramblase-domain-containing protein [Nadsonia fulvescens var. elongata DSM 6958]